MKGWICWLLVAPIAVSISGCGARADPDGTFRQYSKPMPSEPSACAALPRGVHWASTPYELEDSFYLAEDHTKRRSVQLQLLHGDLSEEEASLVRQLRAAGFHKDDRARDTYRRAGYGALTVDFEAVEAEGSALPVVANISLDLPASSFTRAQSKRCRAPEDATDEAGAPS